LCHHSMAYQAKLAIAAEQYLLVTQEGFPVLLDAEIGSVGALINNIDSPAPVFDL
jgi:hypothetical protein